MKEDSCTHCVELEAKIELLQKENESLLESIGRSISNNVKLVIRALTWKEIAKRFRTNAKKES